MSSAFERLQKLAQEKKQQEKPKLEIVTAELPNQPNQPNQDNIPNQPNILNQDNQPIVLNQPNQPKKNNVSNPPKRIKAIVPEKDFTKVPNSVTRNAVPERLFKGMSKNTYDALYLKTRGAINPTRQIRATKSDLIRWTGISDVTLDKHLKHLKSVGLVKWEFIIGSHEGNWYEVFIPEEIDLTNLTNLTNPMLDNLPKKVGGDIPNFLGGVGGVLPIENKDSYGDSKTILKTNTTDDDSALAKFAAKLEAASQKLTGKGLSNKDADKWESLAELLVLELEAAASRSDGVSSVPAFLTEVLRRQFFASKQTSVNQTKPAFNFKPDTIGKSAQEGSESFEIKQLDEKGREAALEQLREFADEDFLQDFEKWYTVEDWQWLSSRLNSKSDSLDEVIQHDSATNPTTDGSKM